MTIATASAVALQRSENYRRSRRAAHPRSLEEPMKTYLAILAIGAALAAALLWITGAPVTLGTFWVAYMIGLGFMFFMLMVSNVWYRFWRYGW